MRKQLFIIRVVITFFGLLLLFPRDGDSANASELRTAWQTEWERTLEAANKEREVVIYGSDIYGAVFSEFQKRYPDLKVILISSLGPQMAQRIMSERRAGKYLADLYLSRVGTGYNVLYKGKVLDPIKPTLILPEVVDESKWWNGIHQYVDEKRDYLIAFNGESRYPPDRGLVGGGKICPFGLLNKAPHPNAAKVAINWLLSREGQIAFQKTNPGNDSLRIDIPKDGVAPYARRVDGVRYLDAGRPEFADMAPILKVINEVWKKK